MPGYQQGLPSLCPTLPKGYPQVIHPHMGPGPCQTPKILYLGLDKPKRPSYHRQRYFTPPDSHAYDLVEWERRTAAITSEKGQVIFEQKDVEVPRSWSQLAINVVAQKYFRGSPGSPERETSVRQIIDRVVETLTRW